MTKFRLLFTTFFLTFSVVAYSQSLSTQQVYKAMQKVANWQIDEIEKNGWKYLPTDWTNGAYYTGQMEWAKMANDDRQLKFLVDVGKKNNWKGGPDERFFADDYVVGQTYAELFMLYKDSAMIKPMIELGNDILKQPHTESLLWNFDGGLHNREWAWCDALFMGPPTLAYLYKVTGDRKYLDGMDKLWWRSSDYLYDPTESLYFRDSRFFDKKEKNGAKVFWSRGNGWVIAGLARILNIMPEKYPTRKKYEKIFKDMSKKIAKLQQPDGTWHASLLDPASYPPKETSGTAFFTYALTWGINKGYLNHNEYYPVIKKAWDAMTGVIHENGKLGFVQVPGAAPESVTYDDSEVYGVGAFLLAGTELFKLLYNREADTKIIVSNSTITNRKNEMTEVLWSKLAAKKLTLKNFKVVSAQTGEEIPAQVIYKGKPAPQSIIFPSGTTAGSSSYFLIKKQKPGVFTNKTFGRIVPERKDDFAWENDKIAFRMYGPALEKSGEISNGIDVWAKRTNNLILDKWYKGDDYHKDHGEGLDFFGVGKTLGAGGIAPYIDGKLYPSKNFVSYKVLDNGPLRTSFQLNYNKWNVNGQQVSESKIISLDAGAFLNKVEVNYNFATATLPVAVGIANVPGAGAINWSTTGKDGFIMAYKQPEQEAGVLSIGVVTAQPSMYDMLQITEKTHYNHIAQQLLTTKVKKGNSFVYFQGANWDKEGSFKTFDEWKQYLSDKLKQINQPLQVKIL